MQGKELFAELRRLDAAVEAGADYGFQQSIWSDVQDEMHRQGVRIIELEKLLLALAHKAHRVLEWNDHNFTCEQRSQWRGDLRSMIGTALAAVPDDVRKL